MACFRKSINLLLINHQFKKSISMSAQRCAQDALKKIKEKNPYYEKYADKIAKLQETSLEEFLDRMDNVVNPVKEGKSQNRTYSELLNPKIPKPLEELEGEIPYKKLADIMKVELVQDKNAEEIKKIWFEYHKTKDVLAATLNQKQYDALMERGKKYPIFILPLPRSEGFEFFMLQFASNTVHFTPLLAYQVHAENAPECLTLVYYTDLIGKGLILMRGEYDTKVLNSQEAQCLANELQLFYSKSDQTKQQLLDIFTHKPDQFKHMDLIKEVENIQII